MLAKPISRELLGSSIPARLAYVGIDGEPRVIPIAFLWTGQHVVAYTVPKSAKVRALRNSPRVALTIDTQDQWPPRALLLLDFETTIPKAVEDLVQARQGAAVVDAQLAVRDPDVRQGN